MSKQFMIKRTVLKLAIMLLVSVLLASCKVQITVPEGGDVDSASGAYDCASGNNCIVEVNDVYFSEEFIADPWQGWVFMGWKKGHRHLCHSEPERCHLSTMGLEAYDILGPILESDETFYLEPEFIEGTPIDQALAAIEDEVLLACLTDAINKTGPIQYAEELTQLSCSNNPYSSSTPSIVGIEAFQGLKSLSFLLISIEEGFSLEPLASLIKLQSLSLLSFTSDQSILDISPLAGLTRLESLSLHLEGSISDISPLAGLTRLESLYLKGSNSDISPLAGLTRLESLYLNYEQISDISPLAGLTRLKSLDLSTNQISDISSLGGLTQLEWLDLSSNQISDISSLGGLTQLEWLDLSWNQISDISPLAGLTRLETLELPRNKISDISPLGELASIRNLKLARNQISTAIDTLDSMPSLLFANLSHNPISCSEIAQLRRRPYIANLRSGNCP